MPARIGGDRDQAINQVFVPLPRQRVAPDGVEIPIRRGDDPLTDLPPRLRRPRGRPSSADNTYRIVYNPRSRRTEIAGRAIERETDAMTRIGDTAMLELEALAVAGGEL